MLSEKIHQSTKCTNGYERTIEYLKDVKNRKTVSSLSSNSTQEHTMFNKHNCNENVYGAHENMRPSTYGSFCLAPGAKRATKVGKVNITKEDSLVEPWQLPEVIMLRNIMMHKTYNFFKGYATSMCFTKK